MAVKPCYPAIGVGIAVGILAGLIVPDPQRAAGKRTHPATSKSVSLAAATGGAGIPGALAENAQTRIPVRNLAILRNLGLAPDELAECAQWLNDVSEADPIGDLRGLAQRMGLIRNRDTVFVRNMLAAWMLDPKRNDTPEDLAARLLATGDAGAYFYVDWALASADPAAFARAFTSRSDKRFTDACVIACLTDPLLFEDFANGASSSMGEIKGVFGHECMWLPADQVLAVIDRFAKRGSPFEWMGMNNDGGLRLAREFREMGYGLGDGKIPLDSLPTPLANAILCAQLADGSIPWSAIAEGEWDGKSGIDFIIRTTTGLRENRIFWGKVLVEECRDEMETWSDNRLYGASTLIANSIAAGAVDPEALAGLPSILREQTLNWLVVNNPDPATYGPVIDQFDNLEGLPLKVMEHDGAAAWELQGRLASDDATRAAIVEKWFRTEPYEAFATTAGAQGEATDAAIKTAFQAWVKEDSWSASMALSDTKNPAVLSWAGEVIADAIEGEDPEGAQAWRTAAAAASQP